MLKEKYLRHVYMTCVCLYSVNEHEIAVKLVLNAVFEKKVILGINFNVLEICADL